MIKNDLISNKRRVDYLNFILLPAIIYIINCIYNKIYFYYINYCTCIHLSSNSFLHCMHNFSFVSKDKYASNQKFGLCEALLEIGAWEVAQNLFSRLPDYCLTDQRPIALALCKMIQSLIEPAYKK